MSTLSGIWVQSPAVAFAAGGSATLSYDGTAWMSTTIAGAPALVDVWGTTGDVFAISNVGEVYRNGALQPGPAPSGNLNRLWGRGPDDIVAVGGEGSYGEFDGASWNWQSFGGLAGVNDVWGADVFVLAVGEGLVRQRPATRATWGSAAWNTIAPPNGTDMLLGVWATSASDFYVVGNAVNDVTTGVAHHWVDGTWMPPEMLPAGTRRLHAIWGSGPNDIHAVGDRGTFLHYDGVSWTSVGPDPAPMTDITDVAGSGRDAMAIGADGSIWRLSPP